MSGKKHFRVYIPRIIGGLLAIGAIVFVVKLITGFVEDKPKNEKKIQPITLLKPPPPPPPPPKIETPPPPEIKQQIDEPQPDPEPLPDTPDDAPARDLGLDAEGTAGSDAFGLAARKGGTGMFGGGDPHVHYGNMVKNDIVQLLAGHDELRRKSYSAVVKIWLKSDGSMDRFELSKGSNDAGIDEILTQVLEKYKKAGEPLPPGLPQPIKFKISSRV
jgi:protein TonB